MVIEVFISASGMPSKRARRSPRWRDRDADLADLAAGELVVGVVAGLGRQVEGDREAGLALGQVAPVERVGLGRRGVPGVRAHDPGAVPLGWRRGPHARRYYSPVTSRSSAPATASSTVSTRCRRVTRSRRSSRGAGVVQDEPAPGQLGPAVGAQQHPEPGGVDRPPRRRRRRPGRRCRRRWRRRAPTGPRTTDRTSSRPASAISHPERHADDHLAHPLTRQDARGGRSVASGWLLCVLGRGRYGPDLQNS